MKINHAIKKIAAVGTGAMLLGVSAAAVSADLSDYPAPFIQDGVFSGTLVLGESAATTDVLGSIEIVASLQAAATSPVEGEGSGSESVLEDSVRIASGSSNLAYGVDLSAVKSTLTDDDLDMLADVEFEDEDGSEFDAEFRIALPNAAVTWDDGELESNDDPTFYLDFSGGETWSFDVIFPDAINVSEFKGESIFILGEEYTFGQGDEVDNTAQELTLYKSGTRTTIEAGSPETVVVDGEDVEISVLGANTDANTATIVVNGEAETVEEGDYVTVGGVRLYVDDVFIVNIPTEVASVRLFVGADKLILNDGAEVARELNGDEEDIRGTLVTWTGGNTADVSQIRITYTPQDHEEEFSENVNDDVSALLLGDEYVDPVFDQIKFAFTDVVPAPTSSVKELISIYPNADDEFSLEVANYNGQEYDVVLLVSDGTEARLAYNDAAAETYVLAANYDADGIGAGGITHTQLVEDNRFILRDTASSEYTRFLELADVDVGDEEITLRDLASGGETRTFSAALDYVEATIGADIDADNAQTSTLPYGTFSYDGFDYGFVILTGGEVVLVDAGTPANPHVMSNVFVTEKGAELTIPVPAGGGTGGALVTTEFVDFNLLEETQHNDDNPNVGEYGDLDLRVTFTNAANTDDNQLRVTGVTYNPSAAEGWSGLVQLESDDDIGVGTTPYGTVFEHNSDSSGGELSIYYPSEQVYYNVFVGPESAGTSMGGSEGTVMGEIVNAIQVGSAILDTEAAGLVGNENLLVIGGPCVNSVAAELLGNPASCTEGFTQGSAMLKLWSNSDDTVSLLVAGYDGADTRLASRVLANYAEYEGQLVGDEVVVSGTSINNVDISAPVVTEDDSE